MSAMLIEAPTCHVVIGLDANKQEVFCGKRMSEKNGIFFCPRCDTRLCECGGRFGPDQLESFHVDKCWDHPKWMPFDVE